MVYAFSRGDLAEPKYEVRFRTNFDQTLKQLQENVLRQVFGKGCVVKEVPGYAVNHALMLPHQFRKSFGIAPGRALQRGRRRPSCQRLRFHKIVPTVLAPNLYTNRR